MTDGQLVKASHGKYNAGWDMWVVRSAFAQEHPDVLRAVLRAFDKAAKYLNSNPAEAAEAIYTMHGVGSAQQLLDQLKADTYPTAEDSRSEKYLGSEGNTGRLAEALMSTWEVMHESGKVRSAPSLETARQAINSRSSRNRRSGSCGSSDRRVSVRLCDKQARSACPFARYFLSSAGSRCGSSSR